MVGAADVDVVRFAVELDDDIVALIEAVEVVAPLLPINNVLVIELEVSVVVGDSLLPATLLERSDTEPVAVPPVVVLEDSVTVEA